MAADIFCPILVLGRAVCVGKGKHRHGLSKVGA